MRNLIYVMPILMIMAFGMANKYKDDPKAPFEAAITIGWWAFGITTVNSNLLSDSFVKYQ